MRKTILITGSSRGIGRAIALGIKDSNFNVVVNYKEREDKAKEVVDILRSRGVNAIMVKADISDYSQVEAMHEKIRQVFGDVDILVNNAGIAMPRLAQDVSPQDWHEIFSTNLDGMFYNTHLVLKPMISKKAGAIVNISSIWGQTGGSMETAYSATKGAIISYSKSLAAELGPSNIRVNVVAPGAIDTDMLSDLSKETLDAFASDLPLQRIGQAKEVAELVLFLISDKASYITGQVIGVNGGGYM